MTLDELVSLGKSCGFTHVGNLKADTIHLMPEVRDMCKSNTCQMYGKNWCCPPGVGDLDTCRENISKYRWGILVQTVGDLEDSMDFESMVEIEKQHKKAFESMREKLEAEYPDLLPVGSGTCTRCKVCTYPDQPCRFPKRTFASMEAYGMLVNQVCKDNDMKYYYGPNTLAYTACFLLE